MSADFFDTNKTYGRTGVGYQNTVVGDPAEMMLLDDILYQLQQPTDTEGQFAREEALAENAYTILSYIQDNVPAEQQADVVAEYLRESGFSSDVVSQMLNIPKSDVNAALAGAGYGPTGLSLTAPVGPGTNIPTTVTSGGTSNVVQDAVDAVIGSDPAQAVINTGKAVGAEVGKIIDKVFQTLGLPAPTKIIGKPNQQAGTIVWGQTGGSPVVYTGTTPAGTQTGVTTGLPWVDAIINRSIQVATGQSQIPDAGQISSVIIQEAAREALGLPAGADMSQVAGAVQQAAQAATNVFKVAEDTEGTDLFGIDLTGTGLDGDGQTKTTTTTTTDDAAKVVGSTDPLVGGLTTEQAEAIGAAEVEDSGDGTLTFGDLGDAIGPVLPEKPDIKFTPTIQTKTVETSTGPKLDFTPGEQFKTTSTPSGSLEASLPGTVRTGFTNTGEFTGNLAGSTDSFKTLGGSFEGSLGGLRGESSLTPAEMEAILASERTSTVKSETSPELKTTLRGGAGGGGGGGGFSLPSGTRRIKEEPGGLVDIDYLYDFAKGLDQPFITTSEDEEMNNLYMYAEGGDVDNQDAVDMVTRRPGEYGRTYFDYATPSGFTPTGRALGGGALNPNAIQIPEYNYTRTLKPEFGGPAGGATYTPPTIDTPPAGTTTPAGTSEVSGLSDFLGSLQGIFGGGGGSAGSTFTPGASDTTTTTTTTPAESTFSLGDTTTTETFDVASDPVSQYLESLGYGLTPQAVTAADIQSALDNNFSLADIAGAFGTTTDILNQILNPTTTSTETIDASGIYTAGEPTSDTQTTVADTEVNKYLQTLGYGLTPQAVTAADIQSTLDEGYSLGQIADAFGTTTDILNQILKPTTTSNTTGTAGSSTYTAGGTDTSTVKIKNNVRDYLTENLGFVIGTEKAVTQEHLKELVDPDKGNFTVEQIAAGLNTSVDNVNALLNYEYAAGGRVLDAVDLATGGMTQGYEDGGRVVMFDQFGRTNPPPGAFITEISTKNPMGPPDPASDEFLQLIEALDRQRYEKSTRTLPELLRDIFEDYGYAVLPQHASTFDRMRFNKENPDFLDRLEDMKEARQRVLDAQEGYAAGGMTQGQGYYLGGPTDGMADLIPATIDGTQPAALSDGEFVIPADVVSHLGNGNSDAGAEQLYSMMDRVRQERTGTTKQGPEIDPTKMMPA